MSNVMELNISYSVQPSGFHTIGFWEFITFKLISAKQKDKYYAVWVNKVQNGLKSHHFGNLSLFFFSISTKAHDHVRTTLQWNICEIIRKPEYEWEFLINILHEQYSKNTSNILIYMYVYV